ncbi:hypothetical protein EGW01_06910 [Helicobacter pylori]|uniref:Uncharacterized protein n=1 Tax=Helicobacter pylori TaxID=210 RepID=A0A3N5CEK7_HELPX|nr:hypothetical protein [Helicobacter pylori]RPF67416.1 hypothetical protein EGW01_06910 [Helicobacter pylori]
MSVGIKYEVEVRKWNKSGSNYRLVHDATPLYIISNYDLMGDEEVEICANYFLEIFKSLIQRAPEIEFLNTKKQGVK